LSRDTRDSRSKHERGIDLRRMLASALARALKHGKRRGPEPDSGSNALSAPPASASTGDAVVTEQTQTDWLMPSKVYTRVTIFYALDVIYLALSFHFTPMRSTGALNVFSIAQGIVVTAAHRADAPHPAAARTRRNAPRPRALREMAGPVATRKMRRSPDERSQLTGPDRRALSGSAPPASRAPEGRF
jgi:hypothetical protein